MATLEKVEEVVYLRSRGWNMIQGQSVEWVSSGFGPGCLALQS